MKLDRRQTVLVGAAVAALLVVGVVAALSGGDDGGDVSATERASVDDSLDSTASSSPTGEAPPSSGERTDDAPGDTEAPAGDTTGPTTTAAAAPATTTAGGQQDAPEQLGPAQDPGPTSPPKAGTYTYRYEGEGAGVDGQSDSDGESTTTISDISREGDVVRQSVEITGGQFDSTSTVEWRPDRVLVARSIFRFGGQEADCDWAPDYLQAVLPLREGLTWEGRSSCTVTGFGVPITVERTTTNRVAGLERRRIAGRVLDLWVVQSDDRITFSTNEVRSQVTSWFSPSLGVIAASEGTVQGGGQDGSGEGRFSTELLTVP